MLLGLPATAAEEGQLLEPAGGILGLRSRRLAAGAGRGWLNGAERVALAVLIVGFGQGLHALGRLLQQRRYALVNADEVQEVICRVVVDRADMVELGKVVHGRRRRPKVHHLALTII